MSDKYKTLNFEDDYGDSLLNMSVVLKEPMETEDHREDSTKDSLSNLSR